jgi:hypothetical protein
MTESVCKLKLTKIASTSLLRVTIRSPAENSPPASLRSAVLSKLQNRVRLALRGTMLCKREWKLLVSEDSVDSSPSRGIDAGEAYIVLLERSTRSKRRTSHLLEVNWRVEPGDCEAPIPASLLRGQISHKEAEFGNLPYHIAAFSLAVDVNQVGRDSESGAKKKIDDSCQQGFAEGRRSLGRYLGTWRRGWILLVFVIDDKLSTFFAWSCGPTLRRTSSPEELVLDPTTVVQLKDERKNA